MKKIISIILLTLIFTLLFSLCASAEALPDAESGEVTGAGTATDAVNTETEGYGNDGVGEDNFFVAVYSAFSDYLPEILSALAFIGSLLLAFFYKKGLLPLIKASLGALTGIVGEVKKKTEEGEAVSRELNELLTERLGEAEGALNGLTEKFASLENALSAAESRSLDKEKMTLIMTTQIELLYDIFMSSSIPQFQKETVGECVAKMKEALKDSEACKS